MPNGPFEEHCRNCTSWTEGPRRFGRCSRHDLVLPGLDDYTICRDWQGGGKGKPAFLGNLGPGVLYHWSYYGTYPPEAVGRFEQLKEFRLDHHFGLYENPTNGWSVQLRPWEPELFPAPGEPLQIHLDRVGVPFAVRDAPVTTTYTGRSRDGEREMEDRTELKRILVPAEGHEAMLMAWIERHYDLSKERERKAKHLQDPRQAYKDKVLILSVRIVGAPDSGYYELLRPPTKPRRPWIVRFFGGD